MILLNNNKNILLINVFLINLFLNQNKKYKDLILDTCEVI